MDWVHCNLCFHQPGQQPKREFLVTSCGHIMCKCCERAAPVGICKVCAESCSTTTLSSKMEQDVRTYFEDPDTFLQKTLKVMEFQNKHRMRLVNYFKTVWEKYQQLKFSYQKKEEERKKLEEENKNLKKELEKYRNELSVMISPAVPVPSPNIPLFSRSSQGSQVIRMQNQSNKRPNSPFFVTPTRPVQNYRNQINTPSTPMSDNSTSPLSVSSQQSYRSQYTPTSISQQRAYRPGLTPPMRGLSLLSVNGEASSRY